MSRFLVFSGTTEGRETAAFLSRAGCEVTVCVATEYGTFTMGSETEVDLREGRLDASGMEALMDEGFDLIIDATHPFAREATRQIREACKSRAIPLLRILREMSELPEGSVVVKDAEEAAEHLRDLDGTVLLMTGVKDLSAFSKIPDYGERVFARVLPSVMSLEACRQSGLPASHIFAMQGPFSVEMNRALIKSAGADVLVTKDSGASGGFPEKAQACLEEGCALLVIGRPEESGMSLRDALAYLKEAYGLQAAPDVLLAGTGPGSAGMLSEEAFRAVERAEAVIGAERLRTLARGKPFYRAVLPEEILGIMENHPEHGSFAVLMTGDTGFYSGAKKLCAALGEERVLVLPGISSLSCLSARTGISYEDAVTVSMHGRDHRVSADVIRHKKVFCLTGGTDGMRTMLEDLAGAGLTDVQVTIGERLSYPDEKIHRGRPAELLNRSYDSLSCAFIENPAPSLILTPGLPDTCFIRSERGGKTVPMTKSEVRAVILSKMQPRPGGTYIDVGAGTGSVSVELSRIVPNGEIYAVEKRKEAAALIEENRKKFMLENLSVIKGEAPASLKDLPPADAAFIGGSGGNLEEIITSLLEKNPRVRIVVAAVTLETEAEMSMLLWRLPVKTVDVVSLQTARAKQAGPYHMMRAQNPVTLFTVEGNPC